MKEHNLLEAISGDTIIFCEGENILHSRLRGTQEMFLNLKPVFFPTGGLKDRIEFLVLQGPTGPHRIRHQTLNLQFGDGQGIYSSSNPLYIPDEVLDTCADRGLNL
jgi:hypothetical protein